MPRPAINVNKTRINFYLPDKHLNALKVLASRRGCTYSDLLRAATLEFLQTELAKEKANDTVA